MPYNFDKPIERRSSGCSKWNYYDEDVIPMWVADMDFQAPEPVLQALHERVDHGVFGYGYDSQCLIDTLCDRMAERYNWEVSPDDIVLLPGVVSSFNRASLAFAGDDGGVLMQVPVYPPFLSAPDNQKKRADLAELSVVKNGTLRYEVDFDVFEAAIQPSTGMFLLCNPHNPVGRAYNREELMCMAEICARHNLIICSDEIHCELMMAGHTHLPIASIDPEISGRTITLMAPSKTFNIPGLDFSFAIIQNPVLKDQFMEAGRGLIPYPRILGTTAAQAAYEEGDDWLAALLVYLTDNRDFLVDYVKNNLPGLKITVPEGCYLAWIDCRDVGIAGSPYQFFLEKARVAFNDGSRFGPGGKGFIRINYGCPRSQLVQALDRMKSALAEFSPA